MGVAHHRRRVWISVLLVTCLGILGFVWFTLQKSRDATVSPIHVESMQSAAAVTTTETSRDSRLRVGIIGDSITVANSRGFNGGSAGDLSWAAYLPADSLRFIGGWSKNGADTDVLAQNAEGLESADVVVIMAAVLDPLNRVGFDETAAHITDLVATTKTERVLISTIAPYDSRAADITAYNTSLQSLAATQGWEFVDATAGIRSGDRFATGMSDDGIHLTKTGAETVAAAVAAAITGSGTDVVADSNGGVPTAAGASAQSETRNG